MVRVHCIMDCLSYALQSEHSIECRPLYFSVWDAPFGMDPSGKLDYIAGNLNEVLNYVENLIGYCGKFLRDFEQCIEHASQLSVNEGYLIMKVDLYYLPYPNKCYQSKHMPHFVVINGFKDGQFLIIDPYFSWQGTVSEQQVSDAFGADQSLICFELKQAQVNPPSIRKISESFEEKMILDENELYLRVNDLVEKASIGELSLQDLSSALSLIGVLVDRKNGYMYAISYFTEKLSIPSSQQEYLLHDLLTGWKKVSMLAIRIGVTQRMEDFQRLASVLQNLNTLEFQLKKEIHSLYTMWKQQYVVEGSYI